MPGTLYIVATPVGNLEDLTFRALRILRDEVELIACEDTRQTQKLLTHYGIHQPLISYHEHNETSRSAELIEILRSEKSIALVSDAGTPLLSDPGYRVVRAAIENGIAVVPIPGASALLPALTASGLPTGAFSFLGFLPPKVAARRKRLERLVSEKQTTVVFESPHRILETLDLLEEVFGKRRLVLAREITKLHEEFLRGSALEIRNELAARDSVKGEMTLVIEGANDTSIEIDPVLAVQQLEAEGTLRMDAIKTVAKRHGLPKREVYRLVEERGSNHPGSSRGSGQTDQ